MPTDDPVHPVDPLEPGEPGDLVDSGTVMFRAADDSDLPAMAEVFLRARAAAYPWMPPSVHTADDVRAHYRRLSVEAGDREAWVAVAEDGRVVGFAELRLDWLDDLYILPQWSGKGLGSTLLELVKAARPHGFELWVFESNQPAREFYRTHGLDEIERTDGSDNEEQAPDIRMSWAGR